MRCIEKPIQKMDWGDIIHKTRSNQLLTNCFLNIGGIPATSNTAQGLQLQNFLESNPFDVTGFGKTNVAWKKLAPEHLLKERSRSWFTTQQFQGSQCVLPLDNTLAFQPGGTLTWATGGVVAQIGSAGSDNWGRWMWLKFCGQAGKILQIITGYCPVLNKTGPISIWNPL